MFKISRKMGHKNFMHLKKRKFKFLLFIIGLYNNKKKSLFHLDAVVYGAQYNPKEPEKTKILVPISIFKIFKLRFRFGSGSKMFL